MKTIKILGIFFILHSHSLFSQEDIALSDPFLSLKYSRGEYLLYDCLSGHWVCTASNEYNQCSKMRTFEIKERKDRLSCVPVKAFDSEKSCVETQKSMTNRAMKTRLCDHPNVQKLKRLESRN